MSHEVTGQCPMGCAEERLRVEDDGTVVCQDPDCPNPTAVTDLLTKVSIHHEVWISHEFEIGGQWFGGGFTIVHPLRERIPMDGPPKITMCRLHTQLQINGYAGRDSGHYTVMDDRARPGRYVWVKVTPSINSSDEEPGDG